MNDINKLPNSIFFTNRPSDNEVNEEFPALAADIISLASILQDERSTCYILHKDESVSLVLELLSPNVIDNGLLSHDFIEAARAFVLPAQDYREGSIFTTTVCLRRTGPSHLIFITFSSGSAPQSDNARVASLLFRLKSFSRSFFGSQLKDREQTILFGMNKTKEVAKQLLRALQSYHKGIVLKPFSSESLLTNALVKNSRRTLLVNQNSIAADQFDIQAILGTNGVDADLDPVQLKEGMMGDFDRCFPTRHFCFLPGGWLYMPFVLTECPAHIFKIPRDQWKGAGDRLFSLHADHISVDLLVSRMFTAETSNVFIHSVVHCDLPKDSIFAMTVGTLQENRARSTFQSQMVYSLASLLPGTTGWRAADLTMAHFFVERIVPLHGYTYGKIIHLTAPKTVVS